MAVVISASLIFQTGCFGSFSLSHKVYDFNASVGDKFVNTIVFWAFCIIPVYEVTLFLDTVLLNLIEFWSGSNPVSMNEGETEIQIVQAGDNIYEITATRNKMHIEQISGSRTGEWADIIYNPEEGACYLSTEGKTVKVAGMDPENADMLNLFLPDGKMLSVDPDSRDLSPLREYMPAGAQLLAYE